MYVLKRVGQAVFVLLATITISFVLYRMLPLGPMEIIEARLIEQMSSGGQTLDPKEMQRVKDLVEVYTGMRPDVPLHIAYMDYMSDIVLYQDFGRSIVKNEPVFDLLLSRMPWSLFVSIYGLALGMTTSLLLGAVMAYNEGSKLDSALTVFSIVNTTIPYYIVAIAFIVIFAFNLEWFPTGGRMTPDTTPGFNYPYIAGVVWHGVLPIASAFIAGFAGSLSFRGNAIREMGKDYIRIGRLRGVSDGRLAVRYVGRNALLPIYTSIMMGIAGIFSSSIILETLFNYQAMGLLTFQALQSRDYPLLMGALIFFTAMTVVGILIADLTYGLIDPRVKGGGERESF